MTLSTGKRRAHFKTTNPTDPHLKPIGQWHSENRGFLADFCAWLRDGGYAQSTIHQYGVSARLALAFLDRPWLQIDIQPDLQRMHAYLATRPLSAKTVSSYQKGLNSLARYLRQRHGLPEPEKTVNWDGYLRGVPDWLARGIRNYVEQRSRAWQLDNHAQLTRTLLAQLCGFARFANPGSLKEITPKSWFAYLAMRMKMGGKPSGNNTVLWTLQSFLRFQQAADQEICARMLIVRPQKTGSPVHRDLPAADIKAMLQAAPALDQAWLVLMVYIGLRTCEVRRLKWADVDIERRSLRIGSSKLSDEHVLPITQPVLDALETLVRSSEFVFSRHNLPLNRRYCQSRLAMIGKTCEVKATPHQLRHSAATMLLNVGMSVWAVKEILGHKSVETTLGYARTYDSTVAKEYQMANAKSSAIWAEGSQMMVC